LIQEASLSSPIYPRKPVNAVLLSLVLPGFGQFYNGELNKAIWFFLAFAILLVPGPALIALYLPSFLMMPTLLVGLILVLSVWLYGMADAGRVARRKQAYVLQGWQLSGVYVLIFLLCNVLALPMLTGEVRAHQVASFFIPSASMQPGLLPGDILFADMRYNCPGCAAALKRGDVAIFVDPNDRTEYFIKRVIGLPGDRIKISGETVWVNGAALTVGAETGPADERLVTEESDGRMWRVQWNASPALPDIVLTVPPGQAFMLGDNRDASADSRNFGTVPLQDIVGKARQIWFSASKSDGLRWRRLGQVAQ